MDYTPRKLSSLTEQEKKDASEKILFMRRYSSYSSGMIARRVRLTIRDMERLANRQSDKPHTRAQDDVGHEEGDLGELGIQQLRNSEPEGSGDGLEVQDLLGIQSCGSHAQEDGGNDDGVQ